MRSSKSAPLDQLIEYFLAAATFHTLQNSKLGKRTVELVAPARDKVKGRTVGLILKHLQPLVVHESGPVEECLPDIPLPVILHPKT